MLFQDGYMYRVSHGDVRVTISPEITSINLKPARSMECVRLEMLKFRLFIVIDIVIFNVFFFFLVFQKNNGVLDVQ